MNIYIYNTIIPKQRASPCLSKQCHLFCGISPIFRGLIDPVISPWDMTTLKFDDHDFFPMKAGNVADTQVQTHQYSTLILNIARGYDHWDDQFNISLPYLGT
jgi:hypothetical protein